MVTSQNRRERALEELRQAATVCTACDRQGEVEACLPWFQQELRLIQPNVLVCLGATADRAALGTPVTIAAARGRILESSFGNPTVVTMHPSAILRTRNTEDRQAMMRRLVADLRQAARVAGQTVRRV